MQGHVLVVEDDDAVAELICESLRDYGFSVNAVSDDNSAYERVVAIPTINALVVDVNLGCVTSGYDVARFARQVVPEVGVVYMSGAADPASHGWSGVPGSMFLQKPFDPARLISCVSDVCSGGWP